MLHQAKIDSGQIWESGQLGTELKIQNRVDRRLVKNLANTRNILHTQYNLPFPVIHDLLGRSLFALYLEDRRIYPEDINREQSFFDIVATPHDIYSRFEYLKNKFNGDLFPISKEETKKIKEGRNASSILQKVRECFYGIDVISQQQEFWPVFQFQYIPIELISSIYEEFMSQEDPERNIIRESGAFYTPPMLVDFILNEVLPWPDEDNKRYDLKILDPACGSGIFLVESYKRLIARWKYCNPSVKVTKNILEKLLLNSIYGIEINPDAIKVAAFSLYLTMLNYTDPKEVLSDVKFFKPLIRWSNEQEIAEHKGKDTGNNLFQYNTFDPEIDVYNNTFDLVVGNPPWKRNQLDELVGKYLNDHKFPDQIMCAYLDKMSRIIPSGEIALVSTAKLLFNTGKIYESFRQRFFNNNNIEAIINFSILRDVIFEKAKTPAAVIIYLPFKQESEYEHNSRIIYCTPKNTETIKNRKSIVIDASEIKYISRSEIVKKGSNVFKIAMWGNVRDQKLINKLKEYPSLNSMISKARKWYGINK